MVSRRFIRDQRKQLYREIAHIGLEDEMALVEVDVAEQKHGTKADGIDAGLVRAIGGQ
jgi:hypothetical protein